MSSPAKGISASDKMKNHIDSHMKAKFNAADERKERFVFHFMLSFVILYSIIILTVLLCVCEFS